MTDKYWVFTFPSTYYALKAEKVLKEKGYNLSLSPIPRSLTANCVEVIRVKLEMKQTIQEVLESEGVLIEEIHLIEPREKKGLLDKFFGF